VHTSEADTNDAKATHGQDKIVAQYPSTWRRSAITKNYVGVATIAFFCGACGGKKTETIPAKTVDTVKVAALPIGVIARDTAQRTLATAAGGAAYKVDDDISKTGRITGDVTNSGALPLDTVVTPSDSTRCRPFRDNSFPDAPRAKSKSADPTVGNAVVWLVGVTHGPRDDSPKRLELRLQKCQLEPRVQRASVGATLNASTYDAYVTSLKFSTVNATPSLRTEINFNDKGQVVPNTKSLAQPGLIEIRDNKRPYIHGFIAVAPHPFVAVTNADGAFGFDHVPAGTYQLVVWHERLGARVVPVTVEAGATQALHIAFNTTPQSANAKN
jgi:hypothetical protein